MTPPPGHSVIARTVAALTALALPVLLGAAPGIAAEADGWAAVTTPSNGPARAIGSHANGCIAGAQALPKEGPSWVALRPQRNRFWGHPRTLAVIRDLAKRATRRGEALMVADIGQPRGGPATGHASHQTGLDADIRFVIAPRRQMTAAMRENPPEISMLTEDKKRIERRWWTARQAELVRAAARDARVDRIFVHPVIKRELCRRAGSDRAWLRKVVPWYGHDDHMHLRIACPIDNPGCNGQAPIPEGDGCGVALAWWFTPEPYKPGPVTPKPAKAPPAACAAMLAGD